MISRTFTLAGFFGMVFIFVFLSVAFEDHNVPGIVTLELADNDSGVHIVNQWQSAGLIKRAALLTWLDFVFIIFYTLLIISVSARRADYVSNPLLNELLRFNIFLAFIIGLCDVVENIIILHNLQPGKEYVSSLVPASMKFGLILFATFVWLASFIATQLRKWRSAAP